MPSRVSQPVTASAAASGNVLIVVEDLKKWTGRIVSDNPGVNTFNYEVRIVGSAAETASLGFVLKTGSGAGDVFLNNNDGDGAQFTAYAIYVAWNTLSAGAINVLFREEY